MRQNALASHLPDQALSPSPPLGGWHLNPRGWHLNPGGWHLNPSAASALLAQWRDERDRVQAELDTCEQAEPVPFDTNSILAELDELEQHL